MSLEFYLHWRVPMLIIHFVLSEFLKVQDKIVLTSENLWT